MSEANIKQRCSELKGRIEVLKKECDTLFGKLSVYIYKNEIDRCYECIGSLQKNFMDSYDMMEEILEIHTSYIDRLEYRIEQLELDRVRQINSVKFLGTYRDWISIFITEVTNRLEKGDWKLVKTSLVRLSKNLLLTEKQTECLKELEIKLKEIGMSLYDIELLRQMKDQNNTQFHSNDQSFDEVKLLLHAPIPDEMNQRIVIRKLNSSMTEERRVLSNIN
ncbi:hypothetical protein GLOIN_2v1784398 [Rhizophagus clarus]|uniref:Uncharacterized protein n=1 Tax=Rhizophagus clarus TaxID=94130 RepID=A0A8H3QEM1_9GLOM|nr:hypothetical protein GLOIN_2v1784398 [Rhizophagus clarus]